VTEPRLRLVVLGDLFRGVLDGVLDGDQGLPEIG
jgi:hypothetical protein